STNAMLLTILVGVAATCLLLPMSSWQSYLAVGDQYFRKVQGDPVLHVERPAHEGPVEGSLFGSPLHIESSSFAVLYERLSRHANLPPLDLALASKVILASLAILLLALVWLRRDAGGAPVFALIVV